MLNKIRLPMSRVAKAHIVRIRRRTLTEGSLTTKVLPILDRHFGKANVLWADQHVSYVNGETIVAQSEPPGERPWFQAC